MTDVVTELEPLEATDTRRHFRFQNWEWRDSGNGRDMTFVGTATVFGLWSDLLWTPKGTFKERFVNGAYEDVLSGKPDVRFLINHDKNLVLGRTKSGTLELEETEDELRVWARVAPTSYALDLRLSMERGDIDQMSVAFEMDRSRGAEERWYESKSEGVVCHDVIKISDLFDVSVVTFPAYNDTEAAMRDLQRAQQRGQVRVTQKLAPPPAQRNARFYKRCRQLVGETVWAIHPPYLQLFKDILDERAAGNKPSDEEIAKRIGVKRDNEPTTTPTGTAVIPLMGPIMPRTGGLEEMSGMKSLADFRSQFRQALSDPSISAIVLDIDSPGGIVQGIPEMAAEIKAARGEKPIVAVANYMAASAAYYLATAAEELIVSPSGEVGSIGVYMMHQDLTGMMEQKGIDMTYIYAGDNKIEGNPYEPLSDEARAYLQADVNETYDAFVNAVADGRGTTAQDVLDNFGQGRMFSAQRAVELGMADRIGTLDEVLSELDPVVTTEERSREAMFAGFGMNVSGGNSSTGVHSDGTVTITDYDEQNEFTREFLGLAARAETDPVGSNPAAPTVDRMSAVAALKLRSKQRKQRAKETRVHLTKEMLG